MFDRIHFERFSKYNTNSSKRNYAWSLFEKATSRFSDKLYENLVEFRRKIGIDFYPSLSVGRDESFKYIIDNLNSCKFIVDGKNNKYHNNIMKMKMEIKNRYKIL